VQSRTHTSHDRRRPNPQLQRSAPQTLPWNNAAVHSPLTTPHSLPISPASRLQDLEPRLRVVRRPPQSQIATTSLNWPTLTVHQRPIKAESRNTLPLFNVLCVRRSLLALTISDLISVLIPMSALSSALYVARPSLASMIARDTRDCTAERRNLSAAAS